MRLVICTVCGMLLGALFYLDMQLLGGYEAAAAIQDMQPIARTFAGHVFGLGLAGAVLAVLVTVAEALPGRRPRTDHRHANYCAAHFPIRGRANRCSCHLNPEAWTPERRRQALRSIDGGRS
jgi:hypothetical protein